MGVQRSNYTKSVDLVVLGSGAGGITAALSAGLAGCSCVVVEREAFLGGTSARSSGTVWVPDNRYLREAGVKGDRARAETYLRNLVGNRGPRSMWERFLDQGPAMVEDLADQAGIAFAGMPGSPDYRQDVEGAAEGWRAMAPLPFDGRRLGEDFKRIAWPLPELMVFRGMMVTRSEATRLLQADRSPGAAWLGARLITRYAADRSRHARGTRLVLGNALVARLTEAALTRGVDLRTGSEVSRLLSDTGRVAEVELTDGSRIVARCGVVLAGGGFPASAEWRARELPEPVAAATPAAPGCTGATIELGQAAGGTLGPSGVDNALWFPSSFAKRADGSIAVYPHIVLDRPKPGSIAVDRTGRRFVNEALSYHEFTRGMYRAHAERPAIPCWMICDRRFIHRYGLGIIRPRTPRIGRFVRSGYLSEGATLAELARKLDLPAETLEETVDRFNGFADHGEDPDFHRGGTLYERTNGDATHGPNPSLGRIETGPFYAVALHPTPLGTSRGLLADEEARVLDRRGEPVPGLYVCGNDMQSAFGGEYPGAGAQLGQAMTFGWIAARHACGSG